MKLCTSTFFVVAMTGSTQAFSPSGPIASTKRLQAQRVDDSPSAILHSRSQFLRSSFLVSITCSLALVPQVCLAKSYSSNARNLDRINTGDFSGGSVYDNNPSTAGARRRRAMQGCKIPVAREEASQQFSMARVMSPKECNLRVMDDSPEFMLSALQTLETTCPYGVDGSR